MTPTKVSDLGPFTIVVGALLLAAYFCFSAVQGDLGILQRSQFESEANQLQSEFDALQSEIARVENKTKRLSESYLDLDLLDEQIRDVLGRVRSDEIVIQ